MPEPRRRLYKEWYLSLDEFTIATDRPACLPEGNAGAGGRTEGFRRLVDHLWAMPDVPWSEGRSEVSGDRPASSLSATTWILASHG